MGPGGRAALLERRPGPLGGELPYPCRWPPRLRRRLPALGNSSGKVGSEGAEREAERCTALRALVDVAPFGGRVDGQVAVVTVEVGHVGASQASVGRQVRAISSGEGTSLGACVRAGRAVSFGQLDRGYRSTQKGSG